MIIRKYLRAALAVGALLFLPVDGKTQVKPKPAATGSASFRKPAAADAELARLRAEVIQRMKESRASAQKLLVLHEEEQARLKLEYQRYQEFYSRELISRLELNQAERALTEATLRVEEDQRRIVESDIAITEATMRAELLRLPRLAVGGYSENGALRRFNGGASWSLVDAPKIEKFFAQRFGRALPVSAFGQTATHDRFRFDHRNAIDVALHPDSVEGRSLLSYLRQSGIPFIAFSGAVAGSATGAHIHIGSPSVRTSVDADSSGDCCKREGR
jgi:hypothetical protein